MAESCEKKEQSEEPVSKEESLECAVCLEKCVHPAQLPCGHIFCFLCIKGFASQTKRCAMCRQEVPRDFIDHPKLLEYPEVEKHVNEEFHWYYEGRNGWWRYDDRAHGEIEEAFKIGLHNFELIICGELYIIDFDNGYQFPKKYPSRKRCIKREKPDNLLVKGIAGLA